MLEIHASALIVTVGYLIFSPAFSATMASVNNEAARLLPRELVGSGMGLLQLIQFFGGSMSVAFCGLLLHSKSYLPSAEAYSYVYGILLIVALVSFGIAFWHSKAAASVTKAVSNH